MATHVTFDTATTVAHLERWCTTLGDKVAEVVHDDARRGAPVRSGRLRSSVYWRQASRTSWRIGATAPYAVYVELGTRYMAAQPYLRPAIRRYRRVSHRGIRR